ncbi:phage baseplate assembly protein V [Paraburkholderia lycopersici]|nr:phage baseplate assembly protein V [Paraburkholderia lycopersici]
MNANESQRQFLNGCRKGYVIAVQGALCRVASGDLETDWIQWFALFAGDNADWLAPTLNEGVMLLCPSGDPAQAVALRGYYSEDFPPPSTDPNKHVRKYRDGAIVQYDFATHELDVTLPAGATINVNCPVAVNVITQTANVKADAITLDGDTTVTKSLTVQGPLAFQSGMTGAGGTGSTMQIDGAADFTGEVKSAGISLPHHSHREQGDGNLVSEPQ